MGGLVIETIRPGVQFVPDAAAAFRRAEAQVQRERGRNIDVNSTYRSWDYQMSMFNAWNAYVGGWGPYPGHSKAVHPRDSFHVSGLAVDSDDWRDARIVQILAENGFIRNRLYVPNEEHHFEYIRSRDKNYGKPLSLPKPKPKVETEMRSLFNKDDKNEETRRATVGELTFHVIGPGASKRERRVWGKLLNVSQAEWDGILALTNSRRAMVGLAPLKGVRGEF